MSSITHKNWKSVIQWYLRLPQYEASEYSDPILLIVATLSTTYVFSYVTTYLRRPSVPYLINADTIYTPI